MADIEDTRRRAADKVAALPVRTGLSLSAASKPAAFTGPYRMTATYVARPGRATRVGPRRRSGTHRAHNSRRGPGPWDGVMLRSLQESPGCGGNGAPGSDAAEDRPLVEGSAT